MKSKFVIVVLVLVMAIAAAAQPRAEWVKYTSAEGRYSVSLPETPKTSQQESTGANGAKFPQFLATASKGGGVIIVAYFDLMPDTVFDFDAARDGMLRMGGGKLSSETSISLGGSPGREITAASVIQTVKYTIRARIYEVGKRIYALEHLYPAAASAADSTETTSQVFDSFKIETPK